MGPAGRPLTVVVPVGPGDRMAPGLVSQLAGLDCVGEVRVACCSTADAGASQSVIDATPGARARLDWQVLLAPRGRAAQQNAGARAVGGRWLWFLHADSQLAPGTAQALERFLSRPGEALGFFDLRFLGDGPWLVRLNALGAWWRSRLLRMPFGDQGLLLPRARFQALGGFDERLQRGEDHDLVWRARHAGVPVRAVGACLHTSARRYAEHGWLRTTCGHQRETWRQARRFARPGASR